MKKTRVLSLLLCSILYPMTVQPVDGVLDPSFGTGGIVSTAIAGSSFSVFRATIMPDGKIAAVGYTTLLGVDTPVVARFLPNGTFDTTFASDGLVIDLFVGTRAQLLDLGLLADCTLVAAGFAVVGGRNQFLVAEYTSEGVLNESFGNGGFVTTLIGTSNAINGVQVQTDGKIVGAGNATIGGVVNAAVARYESNGDLDASFGNNGIVTTAIPGATVGTISFFSVDVQEDGKIVVGGQASIGGVSRFILVRYNPDGTLDQTFGVNGIVNTPIPTSTNSFLFGLRVQLDGKIVGTGAATVGGLTRFATTRYNTDGSLDTTFGDNGTVISFKTTSGNGSGRFLAFQTDGKIVVAGQVITAGVQKFAAIRYNTDGSPDSTFGTNGDGTVITQIGTIAFAANAFDVSVERTIRGNGNIVLAGYGSPAGTQQITLARYLNEVITIPGPISCVTQAIFDKYCNCDIG